MNKKILEFKNLTKYYGKILGVRDLSLTLYESEIFGFIGPNGAGKSTIIRSIMNLINKTIIRTFKPIFNNFIKIFWNTDTPSFKVFYSFIHNSS